MHHRVVKAGIELLPQTLDPGGAQLFQSGIELGHDHFHAPTVGLILGGLGEGADKVIVDRQELCHRVGLDVGVKAVFFLLAALAVVVILGQQTEITVVCAFQLLGGAALLFFLFLGGLAVFFGGLFVLFLTGGLFFGLFRLGFDLFLYFRFLLGFRDFLIFPQWDLLP